MHSPTRAEELDTPTRHVVCDLDGTISDDRARRHLVSGHGGRKKDFPAYFALLGEDRVILEVAIQLDTLHRSGARIHFLTGRPQKHQRATEDWLEAQAFPFSWESCTYREDGDFRANQLVKAEALEALDARKILNKQNCVVFDNDIRVVEYLRELGWTVYLRGHPQERSEGVAERTTTREGRNGGHEI